MLASHFDWCLSVCRLFHLHMCILVTSQRSVMLMTLFPPHSRCVRRRHVHIILSLYRSSSSRLFLKLETPHTSPDDIPFSSVCCCCSLGIGHGPSSIRVHNNNPQCQSGPSAPLPPTSPGSFSVPLKCVFPVPKVHIFIPAFRPPARPWASGWAFWRCAYFHLFGKRMSNADYSPNRAQV